MEIVNKGIEEYLYDLVPSRDEVLQEMEKLGQERDFPIVGPLVGRLLFQLATITGAKRIFEMGSGFGYSAYWFAKAIGKAGTIFCTENSQDNAVLARDFFKRGGLESEIDFRVGDALSILDNVDGEFDIIFNDVDKHQYPAAIGKGLPRLKKGGLFISDNVLWSGRPITNDSDKSTKGIREFNRIIYESKEVFTTIIPLRDGVSVSVKL